MKSQILNGFQITEQTRLECKFCYFPFQRAMTLKIRNPELWFLCSARRLMLVNNHVKFHQDTLNGSQVTERTPFVTDRRTDGQTTRATNHQREEEKLYYPNSENKGADQLRSYCEADLRLCFRIGKSPVFSICGSSMPNHEKIYNHETFHNTFVVAAALGLSFSPMVARGWWLNSYEIEASENERKRTKKIRKKV